MSPELDRADGHRRVVWFVNQYAGSPRHGMEYRHYELGRQLTALGFTVVVISGTYSHLYTRQPTTSGAYTFEDVDGLTYCWVRVPRYRRPSSAGRVWNMLVFMARLYRLPRRRLPSPDAIVVSSPSPFPILPAERWARSGARLVFEVRDVWPLTLMELGGMSHRHPLIVLLGWFERRAYRVADTVVTVLPGAGPHMVSRGMAADKVAVIENGVSPEAFADAGPADAVGSTAPPGERPFTVGFVGTLGAANALDTLVEAARRLAATEIRFELVGQGPERARLERLARDLPNVTFTGPVPKAEVPSILGRYDACYVGFHRSALYRLGVSPNKIFDYMAAGRPILLSADPMNDLVRTAGCGVTVPPDDPVALAEAICSMQDRSRDERDRMGARGREYVRREHSYEVLAGRYARLLEAQPA